MILPAVARAAEGLAGDHIGDGEGLTALDDGIDLARPPVLQHDIAAHLRILDLADIGRGRAIVAVVHLFRNHDGRIILVGIVVDNG